MQASFDRVHRVCNNSFFIRFNVFATVRLKRAFLQRTIIVTFLSTIGSHRQPIKCVYPIHLLNIAVIRICWRFFALSLLVVVVFFSVLLWMQLICLYKLENQTNTYFMKKKTIRTSNSFQIVFVTWVLLLFFLSTLNPEESWDNHKE